jgi:hypothetical protein
MYSIEFEKKRSNYFLVTIVIIICDFTGLTIYSLKYITEKDNLKYSTEKKLKNVLQ